MKEEKQKRFMRDEYSKFWITAREKKYGFLDYDKILCEMMLEYFLQKGKILEVGIGTGFPFAQFLMKNGFQIYGIDISPRLINKCKTTYPKIICKVGDAESIEFPDGEFDAVYCLHSTFFFPNLRKALHEMSRVTRNGGYILFDIQNSSNPKIWDIYQKQVKSAEGIRRMKQIIKNFIGMILGGAVNRDFIIYEYPTNPKLIFELFQDNQFLKIFAPNPYPSGNVVQLELSGCYIEFPRLVFLIQKFDE